MIFACVSYCFLFKRWNSIHVLVWSLFDNVGFFKGFSEAPPVWSHFSIRVTWHPVPQKWFWIGYVCRHFLLEVICLLNCLSCLLNSEAHTLGWFNIAMEHPYNYVLFFFLLFPWQFSIANCLISGEHLIFVRWRRWLSAASAECFESNGSWQNVLLMTRGYS